MANSGISLCFSCGQEVGEPPRLNRLESGAMCGACQERVLESLPALLPGQIDEDEFIEEVSPDLEERRSAPGSEAAIDEIEAALSEAPRKPSASADESAPTNPDDPGSQPS